MVRERLYGLALAVPACAAIGGVAYPYLYDGPIWAYDPAVGLFGRRVVIRGHALGAARGSLAGVFFVVAAAAAVELDHQPYRGGWPVGRNKGLDELPGRMLLLGIPPAVTLGGVIGWNRYHDPRPDEDDDS